MAKRICTIEGCGKAHRARGLCSTHYNRTFSPDRHALSETPCAACGRVVLKHATSGNRRPVCSNRCRRFIQFGTFGHEGKELIGPIVVEKSTEPEVTVVPSTSSGFRSRACVQCGCWFTASRNRLAMLYCSDRCALRGIRGRRRSAGGRFWVPDVVRIEIYERDDWTCQLCFEMVEPDADPTSDWFPSLDHVECQSWALVPDHSPANLRTAHRWCNSVRGDESYYSAASLAAA